MATLHLTRNLPALMPRYVSRFSCIGPACEDTCCSGWMVTLDKKTYQAYRQTQHPALREQFSKHVKRIRSQSNPQHYGKIQMLGHEAACPMMDQGMCKVQANLGESYLSNTCFTFPRITYSGNDTIQQALQLSCPEAARLALLAPDAFDFIEEKVSVRPESLGYAVTRFGLSQQQMADLRIFSVQLMRADGLALWQRLALLGVFCEMLTKALHEGQQADIPALIDHCVATAQDGALLEALAQLQPNHRAQALVFAHLWAMRKTTERSDHQRGVVNEILINLGVDPETGEANPDTLVAAYTRGVQRLPQALEAAPHLLDHYVLNEMFMNLFPFEGEDPYNNYLQLISRYGMLRLMLAAQCNTEGDLPTPEQLVRTVQVYSRRFRHDARFATQTNDALRNSEWGNLDKLYAILRH